MLVTYTRKACLSDEIRIQFNDDAEPSEGGFFEVFGTISNEEIAEQLNSFGNNISGWFLTVDES